jgi:hypothetical protein
MKFKKGDYVVLKNQPHRPGDGLLPYDTIFKITKDSSTVVNLEGKGDWNYDIDRFELLDPATLTKLERAIYGI